MQKNNYVEKLKDPRWQKKRLEIFKRDNWRCCLCGDTENTLHVHHLRYKKNADPWDYDNDDLITLCESCHYNFDEFDEFFSGLKRILIINDFEIGDIEILGKEIERLGKSNLFKALKNGESST